MTSKALQGTIILALAIGIPVLTGIALIIEQLSKRVPVIVIGTIAGVGAQLYIMSQILELLP
jgi:hypothetical protein